MIEHLILLNLCTFQILIQDNWYYDDDRNAMIIIIILLKLLIIIIIINYLVTCFQIADTCFKWYHSYGECFRENTEISQNIEMEGT